MANLGPTNIEGNLIIKNQTCTPNMSSGGTSSRVVVLDDDGILRYKTNLADVNHNHDTTYLGINAQASDSAKLGGQLPSYYEPAFNKNTAFNKNFGTGSSDVAKGDHGHSDLHSHTNKTVLDALTQAIIDNSHTHTNKSVLDSLTATVVSDSHSHSNKTILDAFTTALKTSYDGAVANSHTHTNKTVLDVLTQAVIDNSHTHTNKAILDAISASFTTGLKTSYDGAVTLASNALPSSSYTASDVLSKILTVDGPSSGLNADLLDGKHASDFATSTHNHDGTYSTTDTKNTAGATDTSSKIYLVGSTAQSANPQTYTHDTAYVDVDGNLYSGSSKTITNSDLTTNQIVTPTLNPTWTVRNYAGTVVSSPTNPSGGAIAGTSIVLEYGFKPSMIVKGKWVTQAGYDNPTSCSGLCGTSLPASNVETAATSSINLYNSTTYSSTTVPTTTSDYWTISTPKKGITVSGSNLVLPIGNISASVRTQVTYQLPVYYGNITILTITEANVELLTTKTWKNYQSNSKSVSPIINSGDSEYWIYAYPAAWGNLSTISNADGDWMAAFTSGTVNITGAPELAILYKYYITVNRGAFKSKTINFS